MSTYGPIEIADLAAELHVSEAEVAKVADEIAARKGEEMTYSYDSRQKGYPYTGLTGDAADEVRARLSS